MSPLHWIKMPSPPLIFHRWPRQWLARAKQAFGSRIKSIVGSSKMPRAIFVTSFRILPKSRISGPRAATLLKIRRLRLKAYHFTYWWAILEERKYWRRCRTRKFHTIKKMIFCSRMKIILREFWISFKKWRQNTSSRYQHPRMLRILDNIKCNKNLLVLMIKGLVKRHPCSSLP